MAKRFRTYRYEYWDVDIPSDFSEDRDERAQQAVREAEERATMYRIPAVWYVTRDDGTTIRVCRRSRS